jgi:hypothetical protein
MMSPGARRFLRITVPLGLVFVLSSCSAENVNAAAHLGAAQSAFDSCLANHNGAGFECGPESERMIASSHDRGCGKWDHPPIIRGVSPNDIGPVTGGEGVEITGNLAYVTAVYFGSARAVIDPRNRKCGAIGVWTPPGSGTVDVTAKNPDGTSALSPADQYTYQVTP